jgi:hypothetical protein
MSQIIRPLNGSLYIHANNIDLVSNQAAWQSALSLFPGSDVQGFSERLADLSGLSTTADTFIGGDGSNLVLRTASDVRASLALVVGEDVQAYSVRLDEVTNLDVSISDTFVGANGSGLVLFTASDMRASLSLVVGEDVQAYSARLADVSGLSTTADTFVGGDGSNLVLRTVSDVLQSLGLPADANGFLADIAALNLGESDNGHMLVYSYSDNALVTAELAAGGDVDLTSAQALENKTFDKLAVTPSTNGNTTIVQGSVATSNTSAADIVSFDTESDSVTMCRALVAVRKADGGDVGLYEITWGISNTGGTSTFISDAFQVNALVNDVNLDGTAFTVDCSSATTTLKITPPTADELAVSAAVHQVSAVVVA